MVNFENGTHSSSSEREKRLIEGLLDIIAPEAQEDEASSTPSHESLQELAHHFNDVRLD